MTEMVEYRGDFHVHSRRSHGAEMTPEELVTAARAAGLDFLAVTEHNTADTHATWQSLADETLHVILGQEVVTDAGHWLALGLEPGQLVDWRPGSLDRSLADVHRSGGLCVVAHPHAPYPTGTFTHPADGFDAVEVWNGRWTSDLPWQADNPAALTAWATALSGGRRRTAIGNSDAHLPGQLGTPQTVVRAHRLDTGVLLDALRAGRCWVAESAAVTLSFTASAGNHRASIGDTLTTHGNPVTVTVGVGGVPGATITLHTDHGPVLRGTGDLTWSGRSSLVRVEVRHPGGRVAALTNPIFID